MPTTVPLASVIATPSRASLLEGVPPVKGVPSPPTLTRGQRFLGLNGARMLASVHIVAGHLYQVKSQIQTYNANPPTLALRPYAYPYPYPSTR